MTTQDTPLTEVAQLLPRDTAQLLMEYDESIQVATLESMRAALSYWESIDLDLDPIVLAGVLSSLVVTVAPFYQEIQMRSAERARLISQLESAEMVIETLSSTLARENRSRRD